MFERWFSYHQISELEGETRLGFATKTDRDRRAAVPIAVVDDQPFQAEHNLRAVGYDIRVIGDIKNIDEVGEYNVVLCDLQGVGRQLDNKKQGAFIIDELKRNHPEKYVIAYTGGSLDDAITIQAQRVSDYFLRKDADIEEWRDKLDEVISLISDPVFVWKRQRNALIDADVPTLDILCLEDAYVRSVKKGSDAPYREMITSRGMNPDVRAIAQNLIASGIFRLVIG